MKTSMKESLKSRAKGWMPAVVITAALLFSIAAPVRAHDDDHHDSDDRSFGSKTLARVFHDTYWRWFYGKLTLPTDENSNAVLNGTALMPLPNAPGDGTPGSLTGVIVGYVGRLSGPCRGAAGAEFLTSGAPPRR